MIRVLTSLRRDQEAAEYRAKLDLQHGETLAAANKFVEAGKALQAAKLFEQAGELHKAVELYVAAEDFSAAAQASLQMNEFAQAARYFEQGKRYSSAAACYLKLNDEKGYLTTLIKGKAFLEAGLYLEEQQKDSQAIEVLQKIEVDSPDFRLACLNLGKIFARQNMQTLAQEKFERAIRDLPLDRHSLELYYEYALYHIQCHRFAEALKIIDATLAIDYGYKDALNLRKEIEQRHANQQGQPTRLTDGAQVINNRYAVIREIGRGGMGVVYEAMDRTLERKVALKFLPPAFMPESREVKQLMQEARAAARLNHPNIVTVYDMDTDRDSGALFIVMEYVDGVNLKEIIDSSHHLPFPVIDLITGQLCDGLGYAHQRNVVHRDIKSANLIWTDDKLVKIADFGLAKIVAEAMLSSTKSLGSPVYMSPEQVLGSAVDQRSDIYSMGISIFEMVSGKVPFEKGDVGYHQVNTVPPPVSQIRTETPDYLSAAIAKCLQKKPEDRFQNTAELKSALSKK
jgi:tetratricopeptide (TPR) repeat protein